MPGAGARAEAFAEALEATRSRWIGDDPDDVAHWLAQIAHESGQLRFTREIADGAAYENRLSLGNIQPGDGKRFRGRGLIQLTGRDNYTKYGAAAGIDAVGNPELLEQLPHAADVAGWFWRANDIGGRTARSSDRVAAVTKIVNGGENGLADRRKFYDLARAALGQPQAAPTSSTGEAPGYGAPMEPISIALALIPTVVKAIPELAKWFKDDVPVSERNVGLATKVLDTIAEATGSVNAMEAAQKISSDPAALAKAREAIIPMLELVEAGGGGIAGARLADAAGVAAGWVWHRSAAFLMGLLLLPLVYMGAAAVLFQLGGSWPPEVRASALMLVLGLAVSLGGYYFGSSNKASVPGK